jgi:crossover junction endodeoxyribonuclease RuvC
MAQGDLMKLLGVDPGLRTSGYAVIQENRREADVLDAGIITADASLPLAQRLRSIHRDIEALIVEHHPDIMAIEQLFAHYKHPRTAILMGHARGVFLLAAAQHDVEVVDFAATRVKKSLTGNGHATKAQMQRAIQTQLHLAKLPEPADVADALAIALCSLNERNIQESISP